MNFPKHKPTIKILNGGSDPKAFGGKILGDDGVNQLWVFDGKVANRFCDDEAHIFWSNDVEGWNYSKSDALGEI